MALLSLTFFYFLFFSFHHIFYFLGWWIFGVQAFVEGADLQRQWQTEGGERRDFAALWETEGRGEKENEQAEGGKGMGRFLAKELFKISLEQKIKYEFRIIVFVLKMEKWI